MLSHVEAGGHEQKKIAYGGERLGVKMAHALLASGSEPPSVLLQPSPGGQGCSAGAKIPLPPRCP